MIMNQLKENSGMTGMTSRNDQNRMQMEKKCSLRTTVRYAVMNKRLSICQMSLRVPVAVLSVRKQKCSKMQMSDPSND